jgi:hypothetical protein
MGVGLNTLFTVTGGQMPSVYGPPSVHTACYANITPMLDPTAPCVQACMGVGVNAQITRSLCLSPMDAIISRQVAPRFR